jgi:glycerophosphoryl diester phosphodiesterase
LKPEIIAHRGYSARAPENTLSALEAALRAGADALEFDVQTAACGTPVLFHDATLGRTTNGVGPLRRRPLAQLKALDAGGWFSPAFAGEAIPTQMEALALLKGRVRRVYQDVKGYREMEDLDRIAKLTRDAGMAEATVFVSSDWIVLDRLRRVAPEIRRGYTVETAAALPEALDRALVDEGSLLSVEIGVALAEPERVQAALEGGGEVMAWTVDDPEVARKALQLGISRIFSNQVDSLLAWQAGLP